MSYDGVAARPRVDDLLFTAPTRIASDRAGCLTCHWVFPRRRIRVRVRPCRGDGRWSVADHRGWQHHDGASLFQIETMSRNRIYEPKKMGW